VLGNPGPPPAGGDRPDQPVGVQQERSHGGQRGVERFGHGPIVPPSTRAEDGPDPNA
jgi:hypothetical protein